MVPKQGTDKAARRKEAFGNRLKIRWMSLGDIPSVLAIENRSFPTPWSENIFRDEIQSPLCCCLVAAIDDWIAGYIDFSVVWDEVHLRNIAVRSDCRKQGIASTLLRYMITETLKKNARWVTLEVRRSNTGAIELYDKFGFVLTGVRPLYYQDTREDALIMWMDMAKKPQAAG